MYKGDIHTSASTQKEEPLGEAITFPSVCPVTPHFQTLDTHTADYVVPAVLVLQASVRHRHATSSMQGNNRHLMRDSSSVVFLF